MKVIAFFTQGPYEKEADLLERSLRANNIDYYIAGYPAEIDWHHAVALKPIFIDHCRKQFKGPLVSVDVDAFFHSNPSEFFDALTCDFAAHWFQGPSGGYDRSRNDDWFLSGTMYWGDTERARLLLTAWRLFNGAKQRDGAWEGGGQANLRDILDDSMAEGLEVVRLPGCYCYVHDKPWGYPDDEPRIIEHLIASRENKDQSKGRVNGAKRIRTIELKCTLPRKEDHANKR